MKPIQKNNLYSIVCLFVLLLITSCKEEEPTDPSLVKDIDNNTYSTVTIGTQTWMAENLRTSRFNDGEKIPRIPGAVLWEDLTTPAYTWYYNDSAAMEIPYGKLYNRYAVETKKLCPSGWHVASNEEWQTLSVFLMNNGYSFGEAINTNKAIASQEGWKESATPNATGNDQYLNNTTGFNAYPAGLISSMGTPGFYHFSENAWWWTSTNDSETQAIARDIPYHIGFGLGGYRHNDKQNGYSIRCVKDE